MSLDVRPLPIPLWFSLKYFASDNCKLLSIVTMYKTIFKDGYQWELFLSKLEILKDWSFFSDMYWAAWFNSKQKNFNNKTQAKSFNFILLFSPPNIH